MALETSTAPFTATLALSLRAELLPTVAFFSPAASIANTTTFFRLPRLDAAGSRRLARGQLSAIDAALMQSASPQPSASRPSSAAYSASASQVLPASLDIVLVPWIADTVAAGPVG